MLVNKKLRTCDSKPSALLICVNYNSEQDTKEYLDSFMLQDLSESLEAIVVDNSEQKELPEILKKITTDYNKTSVLFPDKNLGFYNGAAWALDKRLENDELPEWVVVSNTDLYFEDKEFFSKLFDLHDINPPEIIAPSIISSLTGVDQNPQIRLRPSKRRMWFYTIIYNYYFVAQAYWLLSIVKNKIRSFFRKKSPTDSLNPEEIYAPHGSFVILNKRYFQKGGSIHHGCFLFGETIGLAETAISLGMRVVYDPRLSLHHKEHASYGIIRSRKSIKYQLEGSLYTYNTFFKH